MTRSTRTRAAAFLIAVAMLAVAAPDVARAAEDPTASDARDRARGIVDSPEYKEGPGSPVQGPIRDVERWFQRNPTTTQPRSTTTTRPRKPPKPPKPSRSSLGILQIVIYVVAILLGLALIALLGFLIVQALRNRDKRSRDDADDRQTRKKGVASLELAAAMDPDIAGISEPDRLDALAAEAEGRGDFSRAVRLRFRAGLMRLDRQGSLDFDPSLTTGQLMRALRNSDFDRLAITFDTVVYGRIAADVTDATTAREVWPRVLAATLDARTPTRPRA